MTTQDEARPPSPPPSPPSPAPVRLTRREALVLANLHRPITLEQLAEELFVTRNTIKTQVRSVYRKLGVSGREAAVDRGRELALVPAREDLSQS